MRVNNIHRFLPWLLAFALFTGCSSQTLSPASASPAESAAPRSSAVSATPSEVPSVASAAEPTPSPTHAPTPIHTPVIKEMTVTVNLAETYQTFLGFGGNYCQVMYTGHALDSIGQYTLETLRPEYVRVPIPLNLWEPVNDNSSPTKNGYFMMQLLNKRDKPVRVTVKGAPEGKLMVSVTQKDSYLADGGINEPANGLRVLELPPKSMVTLSAP